MATRAAGGGDGEQRRKKTKTKTKTSRAKEMGGRWPAIKPKKDLQIDRLRGTLLFTVPNFFSAAEASAFVEAAEAIGFTHQGSLGPARGQAYRDNDRISMTDPSLAEVIWESGLKKIFGDIKLPGEVAVGLNPNIRFYRSLRFQEWRCFIFMETTACYMKLVLLPKTLNMFSVRMSLLLDIVRIFCVSFIAYFFYFDSK
ncbi:hypothetical protein ACMD2_15538 [Ananas comosus]|uniref:Uncharacterized protein n=1 Tax=Ananas comosus TaxID=4615 RepID=A0A199VBL8_ANACO|nr:hypothetical protein ACMD2_15538 [Ananas comosus]